MALFSGSSVHTRLAPGGLLLALGLMAIVATGCPVATPTPTPTATVAAPTATATPTPTTTPTPTATPTPTMRPTATPTPTPTRSAQLGTAVEGWMGTIELLPPNGASVAAAFRRDDGARYGIASDNIVLAQQIDLLRNSGRRVRINGELQSNAAAVEGRRVVVSKMETVGG